MALRPSQQIDDINRRLALLAQKRPFRVVFQPLQPLDLQYFPDGLSDDLAALSTERWEIGYRSGLETADLILVTSHGRNHTAELWRLREANPDALLGLWLWDNHNSYVANLENTLAADFYFPSHRYISGYLLNPCSVNGSPVPLCCAQWDSALARSVMGRAAASRKPRVYAGYVDYEGTPRGAFMRQMQQHVPEIDVRLLPRHDRSRYFAKTYAARLDEWLEYAASLVLPLERDLSTRLFDGLVAGHVLVVADNIADLDAVVPPVDQAMLPLVKFRAGDLADLRRAAQDALAAYARDGEEGICRRQTYALAKHMLAHRVQKMVRTVGAVADGRLHVGFRSDEDYGSGLDLRP